jgi:ubiquinone/menaquinone biosynthesis C-methylase UbiE
LGPADLIVELPSGALDAVFLEGYEGARRIMGVSIADIYDEHVAHRYDEDPFGIIRTSGRIALEQAARHVSEDPEVLDLGMGTGETLRQVRHRFQAAKLRGVDISPRMVELARLKLPEARLVCGDAVTAARRTEPRSIDLAMTHFLLNYVELDALTKGIARALKPDGVWSIVTTTAESFRHMQRLALRIVDEATLRAQMGVPRSPLHLAGELRAQRFELVEVTELEQPIELPDTEALLGFALGAGWFACDLLASLVRSGLDPFAEWLEDIFPLRDVARVCICVARKI